MITLTSQAAEKLKGLLQEKQREDLALRIFVKPGGCRGYSYGMAFDSRVQEDDRTAEVDGVRILIDPFSAAFLEGAEVDYVDSLMGGGFTIRNPNAVSTCGCGQSFRTARQRGEPRSCCPSAG